MYDAIVIGGGLLGVATAYHLVRHGVKVLLVDRGHPGRATDAGAGILSPETNSRDPDAWAQLALRAVEYYPALVALLKADDAGETGYARCGLLVVAAHGGRAAAVCGGAGDDFRSPRPDRSSVR